MFLLSGGTHIDDNECRNSLEAAKKINCLYRKTDVEIIDLTNLILKIYLGFKNISYPINIDYFLWWSWLSQVNCNWLRMNKTGWLLLINLIPIGLFRGSVTLQGGCYNPPSLLYFWITNAMLVELGTIINYYNTINLTLKKFFLTLSLFWWHHQII